MNIKKQNKRLLKNLPTVLIFLSLIFNLSSFAVAGDMDQAIVHYNQGYDYYKKGEYDKAIEELDNSLKFDSDNENAYYGLGNCYYRKQMYEKAVEGYKKSIELNPNFANAHYGLGTAYSALRKTDEADKEFSTYRKLKSGQGQVTGEVSSNKKKKKKKETKKRSRESSSVVVRSNDNRRKPSIKSVQRSKRTSFTNLSPKSILKVPDVKSPKEYIKIFAEMWDNSCIGKVLIGIIGFVGVTQVWLLLIAFQGFVLWKMRKNKGQS